MSQQITISTSEQIVRVTLNESGDPIRAVLRENAIIIQKGGTRVGTVNAINFIEGNNITLTYTNDADGVTGNLTIAATGGAGSAAWGGITGTLSAQTDLQTALDSKLVKASNLSDVANAATALSNLGGQPLDSDLTAIAALTPSNDDIIQRKAGAWTNRTIAQLITDLGLGSLYQPLDSDLTAIAALSTTAYGRALLTLADQAALLAAAGAQQIESYVALNADYTLSNVGTEQKLFNATANGALTLETGLYFFECILYMTSMSGTSGNGAFDVLGGGTATVSKAMYTAYGSDTATPLGANNRSGSASVTAQISVANVVVATAQTNMIVNIQGMFRLSVAGTIIPSFTLTTAAAAVLVDGSYFKCHRAGAHDSTTVGNWS